MAPNRRVYDCISFFNEMDILEMRLHTLDPVVDVFVIAELSITHQGAPKPFNFEANKERFARFLPKIWYIKHDYNHWEDNTWIREHYQRDLVLGGLSHLADEDVVLVSDVDEIPRPEVVANFNVADECRVVEHDLYNYYLNCYAGVQKHERGVGMKIASGKFFKTMPNMIPQIDIGWNASATHLRYRVMDPSEVIPNGGWHFSWQGGRERVIEKLESFAHVELNRDELKDPAVLDLIERGEEPFIYGVRHEKIPYRFVPVDRTFPAYVRHNHEELVRKGMIKLL